ncbi:MAG TPA: hypothetical protein VLA77_00970 [Candidatus Saccharimonadales bacterium]|nr:hypothetical protein [Candidatus Saccharimonadales bacterium]
MKINDNTKKSRKKWIIIIPLLLVLLGGAAFAAYTFLYKPKDTSSDIRPVNTVDYSPPTKTEKDEAATIKENSIKNSETPPTADSKNVDILISRAGQSAPGLPVVVRTLIEGATSGSCEMTFTKGSATFTKNFEIKQDATTYTCNGDIEINNFNDSGDWSLKISVGASSTQMEGTLHVQK